MIIPNNGKVVIFDDKIEQVSELMKALSSNNVPFSFFQDENGGDLPETKNLIKNVRLVFMDIELETGVRHSSESVISIPLSRLDWIIGESNGPYLLFIWSTKYEEYGELFVDQVNNSPIFENKRPIKIIKLDKKELSTQGFKIIKEALRSEIKSFDSLNAFFYWESIINDSAGEITNELISLIKRGGDWNQDTKNILYKLSLAYWGLSIKSIRPDESNRKVLGAYSTLNQVLSDKIDFNTHNYFNSRLDDILESKGEDNPELFAKINEKIHVDSNPQKEFTVPGSVIFCIKKLNEEIEKGKSEFIKEIDLLKKRNIISPLPDIKSTIQKKQKIKDEKIDLLNRFIEDKSKGFNAIINESLGKLKNGKNISSTYKKRILNESLSIEVNITPRCDFAQNKVRNHRFLPGALVLDKYRTKINKNAEYNYISDFKIHYDGNLYFFLFDFRHFYSLKEKELHRNFTPTFRIKESFLNELQVKLSGHISRLGLLYMS